MRTRRAVSNQKNHRGMAWSVKRKMIAGYALAFVILMMIGSIIFTGIQGFHEANRWQNHTFSVINHLQNVIISLQEARGGQRGYVITGDLSYVGMFYRASEQLEQEIGTIRELVDDNPPQEKRIREIQPLINQELGIFKNIIDTRYSKGLQPAIDVVKNGKAKRLLDKIRAKIEVMKAEEVKLLELRKNKAEENANNSLLASIVGAGFVCLIMVTLYIITNREIYERQKAENEVEQRNQVMENALDGIAELDENGCFIAVNKAYAAMLGYRPEELMASPYASIVPAESSEVTAIAYNTMRLEGRSEFEALGKRKDGSTFFKRVVCVANNDEHGKFVGYFCFMKDITEQRYLQDVIKQNEERFRSLIEGVSDYSIISLDPKGNVTSWNAGAEKIKGYTADEILGRHFSCFYPEEQILEGYPTFELEKAKTNGRYEEEGWRIRKDGSKFWANVVLTALHNDNAELIGFSQISRDLTERKQAEERFQVLFEYSSDAHLLFDETGIIDCNDATIKLLNGKNKNEVMRMHPAELSPEYQPDGQRSMVKCLEMDTLAYQNGYHSFEWLHKKMTGEEFPVEVSLTPVMLAGKSAMLTVWHDLTERKAFEKKLIENEAQFRMAMDSAPIGMALVSVEGHFIQVNKALCSIVGYTKEELLALDFQTITHPDDLDADMHQLVKTLTHEIDSYEIEKRYLHKGGHIVWIQLNVYLLRDAAGNPIHFIAQIQDITERKSIQNELLEAKEAALDAVRMKSHFLANMSHEIRTPMNGILGLTEIVMKSPLDDIQRKHLGMVQSSAKSLLNIINDILDFSKIEAGKLAFDPIPFKLRESLEETLTPFSQLVQDKSLELLYRVAPEVPNQLIGDPSRLRQLINNLVGNAVKFTAEGEVLLDISVESAQPESVCLHFKITDTGIGLSPEKQKLIFEPFAQAENSTNRRYGGTGLGLSICKQLVELMQGNIWVDSKIGEGSTFHFTARFDIAAVSPGTIIPVHVEELKNLPVLLVDDNTTNLHIMKESLSYYQMQPHTTTNGKSALEMLQKAAESGNPYPIAILDVLMPEMSGFELAKAMKEEPKLAETKIIIMTAYGQAGDAARCRELGVEAYLTKPLSQHTLIESIKGVLGVANEGDMCELKMPLITKHLLRETTPSLHVLLAEDNDVNRVVAETILVDLGHEVVSAANGKITVEEYKKRPYDLILMDIHMPEMDGFEATSQIRQLEQATGRHIPIIALTANAIKGDKERCLAAGMDGYISKPFERQELVDAIRVVVPTRPQEQNSVIQRLEKQISLESSAELSGPEMKQEVAVTMQASDNHHLLAIIDRDKVLDRLGGKISLLEKVVGMFQASYRESLNAIAIAIDANDAVKLDEAAHAFKGLIGNFSTDKAFDDAYQLEMMGKQQKMEAASQVFESLKKNVADLLLALEMFLEGEKHS